MYWFLLSRPLAATFFVAWYGIPMWRILPHRWDWEQDDDITSITLRRTDVQAGRPLHQSVHAEAADSAARAPLAVLQPVARPAEGWPSLPVSQGVHDRAADSAARAPLEFCSLSRGHRMGGSRSGRPGMNQPVMPG